MSRARLRAVIPTCSETTTPSISHVTIKKQWELEFPNSRVGNADLENPTMPFLTSSFTLNPTTFSYPHAKPFVVL